MVPTCAFAMTITSCIAITSMYRQEFSVLVYTNRFFLFKLHRKKRYRVQTGQGNRGRKVLHCVNDDGTVIGRSNLCQQRAPVGKLLWIYKKDIGSAIDMMMVRQQHVAQSSLSSEAL